MTGISTRSIRHYENLGLLPCNSLSDSNYRLFGEYELKRLKQILLLKSLGFSLQEILEIITAEENMKISTLFENRLETINQEVSKLNKNKELLEAVSNIYKTNGLEYINNFHLIKEMVTMNTKFIRIYNRLNLELQIKILKELYSTGTLKPETLKAIGEDNGHLLLEELHMILVKSLLNGVDFESEKRIMQTLKEDEPEFADVAMRSMFTFDDFAKLPDDTIKIWLEACDDAQLIIALKDSNNYLVDKIVSNLNSTRAEIVRAEIENEKFVTLEKSFQSMNNLIDILRRLERDGQIIIERFN
jgi:DNA-binding transcriptional MerR regulator